MENKFFGLEVTSEFLQINAPLNEKEVKESCKWRIDKVEGFASFYLDLKGVVDYWSPGAVRLTGYTAEEIQGKHFSCLYEYRETQVLMMPQYFLSIAIKQGFHEYRGWWLRRDAPHFLARVIITSMGNREDDFAVMVWNMSKNRRALEVMGERRHKPSVLDG
jgi:PAS domain S-box-containing protein